MPDTAPGRAFAATDSNSHPMSSASWSAVLRTDPPTVFKALADLELLPRWNPTMTRLAEKPQGLEPGAQWVVEFRVLGRTWLSRSTLLELDPTGGRFAYRSATDDGNPSFSDWLWRVSEHPEGTTLTVEWALHPKTFWRKVLLARIRSGQLRSEVSRSVEALETLLVCGADRSPKAGSGEAVT